VEGKVDFSGFDQILRGLGQQNLRALPGSGGTPRP
jgi:hypothetical protein